MYSQPLGAALNYGNQNMIPGKAEKAQMFGQPQQPQQPRPSFMQYQMNAHGVPRALQHQTPFMPNGTPQPQPPQQMPRPMYGGWGGRPQQPPPQSQGQYNRNEHGGYTQDYMQQPQQATPPPQPVYQHEWTKPNPLHQQQPPPQQQPQALTQPIQTFAPQQPQQMPQMQYTLQGSQPPPPQSSQPPPPQQMPQPQWQPLTGDAHTQQQQTLAQQMPSQGNQTLGGGDLNGPDGYVRGSVNSDGVYTPGHMPWENYQQQQIDRFNSPDYQNIEQQQAALVQQLLGNPYSMSPEVVAQLKGEQADTSALFNQQSMGQLRGQLASRGIDPNSAGYALGQQNAMQQQSDSNLLGAFRDIDIQKAQTDRQDLLGALGAATDFQNNALQRAIGGYTTDLQGSQLRMQDQQNYLDQNYRNFMSNEQLQQARSGSIMDSIRNMLQERSINNQSSQFDQTFGLNQAQFDWQKQMDDRNFQASQSAQSSAQQRWEEEQAYQYQRDQQARQDQFLEWLMRATGGGYGGSSGGYGGYGGM